MNKYSFNIQWSDEDDAFIVTCPEFPGLSAFGSTEDQALKEAKVALIGTIKVYEQSGMPLPQPHKTAQYSGQFRVRIPKTLHRQAVEMAEREGVSLNLFVTAAIAASVGGISATTQHAGFVTHLVFNTSNVPIDVTRRRASTTQDTTSSSQLIM